MELTAYKIDGGVPLEIVPADKKRGWLKTIPGIGACLPLTIGNAAGWWLLNPERFTVHRKEMYNHQAVVEPYSTRHAMSHFGYGILTITIPYIFRTPAGWELQIRGPSNYFKDGIHPFEGIVETDWHKATATMNWMVEKDATVTFEEGEPLCQIVPVRMDILETFEPKVESMPEDLEQYYLEWYAERTATIEKNDWAKKKQYSGEYPRNERTKRRQVNLQPARLV